MARIKTRSAGTDLWLFATSDSSISLGESNIDARRQSEERRAQIIEPLAIAWADYNDHLI